MINVRKVINKFVWCCSLNLVRAKSTMKGVRSDGQGGRGITLMPASGSYSNVMLWFHGLGDTADGWASAMPMFDLTDTKFILPTASDRPISVNNGYPMPGWSDIHGLNSDSPEDRTGFEESATRVNRLIQAELDNGIPASKIVIGGFSQGGALALHVALRSKKSLAACVALSSWVPLRKDFPAALSPAAKNLPILQIHGDADLVVAHKWGAGSHKLLKELIKEPEPKFLTIEGMGHSSDPDEIEAVKNFLRETLDQQ